MGSRWEIALRCECSERRLGFQTIMNRTLAIIVAMLLLAAGASHAEAPAESLLSAGRVDLAIGNLQMIPRPIICCLARTSRCGGGMTPSMLPAKRLQSNPITVTTICGWAALSERKRRARAGSQLF